MESFVLWMAIFISIFIPRIVARFRWNLNSKWNRGKPITHWKSIEVRVNKRQSDISKNSRSRERKGKFIYLFILIFDRWKSQDILWWSFYLHSCLNVKYSVRWRHSWLPLRRNNVVGWHSLSAHRYNTHWNKERETWF